MKARSGEHYDPVVLGDKEIQDVLNIFKALADETRLKIISKLTESDSICVSDLSDNLRMDISRISHQLAKLKQLGFVSKERAGKNIYYSLDDTCIRSILKKAQDHVSGE
jgi:DNA-binding transcriptional ArsR family regulator